MGYVIGNVSDVYTLNLSVGLGYVPNVDCVTRFGYNPDLASETEENVWDFGGDYTYSTTADIDTISSSSSLDGQVISILGLDENYDKLTQEVTLNGENKVTLETSLLRVFYAENKSSTDLAGAVYIYVNGAITAGIPNVDSTLRAYLPIGDNDTSMALFTIPKGCTGFVLLEDLSLGGRKSGFVTVRNLQRFFGSTWHLTDTTDLAATGSSVHHHDHSILEPIPEKTDLQFIAKASAASLTIGITLELYVIKNI